MGIFMMQDEVTLPYKLKIQSVLPSPTVHEVVVDVEIVVDDQSEREDEYLAQDDDEDELRAKENMVFDKNDQVA